MNPPIDITGQTFGRLTAIRIMGKQSGGFVWLFKCSCGNETVTRSSMVRSGKTKSCGCLQKEKAVQSAVLARAEKARLAPPLLERFWSKVDKRGPDECWPWKACVRREDEGYGAFFYRGTHHPASRMAWTLTHGEIGSGIHVCHRCDNPGCCNPSHLFLGTNLDNNADKVSKGRHVYGERVSTAKLTEAEALEIKRLKPLGRAPKGYRTKIAARFGIMPGTVTDIWNRTWTHLD